MPIELLRVSAREVESRLETDKIRFIVSALGVVGLKASDLLYCGIEGANLRLNYSGDPARKMTFAASYTKLIETAKDIERNGETHDLGYPLGYAFSDKVELPAIAVYDREELVPQFPEEIGEDTDWCEEWVHKNGGSVDEALKAVMIFDREI